MRSCMLRNPLRRFMDSSEPPKKASVSIMTTMTSAAVRNGLRFRFSSGSRLRVIRVIIA